MSIPITCSSKTPPVNLGPVTFDNSFAKFTHDVGIESDLYVANQITACTTISNTLSGTDVYFDRLIKFGIGASPLVPVGGIIMWSGEIEDIPDGWYLCDGTTHDSFETPDLRSRFIVGYSSGVWDYDEVGNTGGSDSVTLSVNQIPAHTHQVTGGITSSGRHSHTGNTGNSNDAVTSATSRSGMYGRGGGGTSVITRAGGSKGNHNHPLNISDSGAHTHPVDLTSQANTTTGAAHENRPSYYVLAFIIFLGI